MEIHARHIAVNGRYKQLLPPTSLRVAEEELTLVRCLRDEATTLALALSGRIEPDDGAVLLDGAGDARSLRELVAIVDAPRVTEPEPTLPLVAVVAEALGLAGAPASRATALDWLTEQRAEQYAKYRFETLPAPLRTRLLVELAVVDERVQVLVLDSPDRHTGDAQTWWSVALRQAQRGLGVVVLCADGTARALHPESAKVGQMQQPSPILVGPDGVHTADVRPTDPSFGTQYGDVHDEEYPPEPEEAGFYQDEPAEFEEAPTTIQPLPPEDGPAADESQEHNPRHGWHADAAADEESRQGSGRPATSADSRGGLAARLAGRTGAEQDAEPADQNPETTTTLHRVTDREDS